MPAVGSMWSAWGSVLLALVVIVASIGAAAAPTDEAASPSPSAPLAPSATSEGVPPSILPADESEASITRGGVTVTTTRSPVPVGTAPASTTNLDPNNCWPHIGGKDESPVSGSHHGASVWEIAGTLYIQPDPPCEIVAVGIKLNGVDYPGHVVSRTPVPTPPCCTGLPKEEVRIAGSLPAPPSTGTHSAQVWETVCCDCQSGECFEWTSSMTWSFTVSDCGGNSIPATSRSPEGSVAGNTPTFQVTFEDPDIACGATGAEAYLDGVRKGGVSVKNVGSSYVVTWQPTSPISNGWHTVEIRVTELCCNPSDGVNTGATSWSVFIQDCGTRPVATSFGPTGTIPDTAPVLHVIWHDATAACAVDLHSLTVTDALGVTTDVPDTVGLLTASDYYQSGKTTLPPGTYTTTAKFRQVCCSVPNYLDRTPSTVTWTFTILAGNDTTQQGQATIPGGGFFAGGPGQPVDIAAAADTVTLAWHVDPTTGEIQGTYIATRLTATIYVAGVVEVRQDQPILVGLP